MQAGRSRGFGILGRGLWNVKFGGVSPTSGVKKSTMGRMGLSQSRYPSQNSQSCLGCKDQVQSVVAGELPKQLK